VFHGDLEDGFERPRTADAWRPATKVMRITNIGHGPTTASSPSSPAGTICARSLASSARGALRYGAFPVDEQASIKRLFDGEFRSA